MYLLSLARGLVILVLASAHAADMERPTFQEISGGNKLSNFRLPRSVPAISKSALKALIKSAVEVSSGNPKIKKLMKQGSLTDAIADFNSLKPTFVDQGKYTTDGLVGHLKVKLRRMDYNQHRQPTITILDSAGEDGTRIVYTRHSVKLP